MHRTRTLSTFIFLLAVPMLAIDLRAQVVPGSGRKLTNVGDSFEDENWSWVPKLPKSSREQDGRLRAPTGFSTNRRWFESPKRGQPDQVERVATPPDGLVGSKGSLLLRSLYTSRPNTPGYEQCQDDFILACASRVGALNIGRTPSFVTRVWLPPFDQWEDRTGTQFGIRADLKTTKTETKRRFLFSSRTEHIGEAYWPGFFIQFHSETDRRFNEDSAMLLLRCDQYGREISGPAIRETGWWTFGMSFTPDGRAHYYASPGVDPLTRADYITSTFPYSYRAERFATMFFNVVNSDNGKTWSTPFIVDDTEVFVLN